MSRPSNHPIFPSIGRVSDALLLLLLERGGDLFMLWARDTYGPLADFFSVSGDKRAITRNKYLQDYREEPYWHTWVQSSHNRLVQNGDIHASPHRGLWRLTERGKHRALQIAAQTRSDAFAGCILPVPSPKFLKPMEEWEEFTSIDWNDVVLEIGLRRS
jgi:hypothetical protein